MRRDPRLIQAELYASLLDRQDPWRTGESAQMALALLRKVADDPDASPVDREHARREIAAAIAMAIRHAKAALENVAAIARDPNESAERRVKAADILRQASQLFDMSRATVSTAIA